MAFWGSTRGFRSWRLLGNPAVQYVGGCQSYGPFLDPYYNKAPAI